MHIDRIKVYGPLEHTPVGHEFYRCLDGEFVAAGAEAYTPQRRKNPRPDDIYVKSSEIRGENAYQFLFDCCPPQGPQGHNMFGHGDLWNYVFTTFKRQTAKFGITPSEEEMDIWQLGRGRVRLAGIHLTANFGCPEGMQTAIRNRK